MKHRVIIPPSTEPVTLAEAKAFLRANSSTFGGETSTAQSIKPSSYAISTVTGDSVDVLGKLTLINLNMGACGLGGSVAAKIQHSDSGTTWLDYAAFTAVTETNDNAIQAKEYTGGKKYVRVVAAVTGAACEFGADVVLGSGETIEDGLISDLITAAREYCEDITGQALATQTVVQTLDRFPCEDEIELWGAVIQSVTSVKYTNSAEVETTMMENTDYLVDTDSVPGRIILPYSKAWPTVTLSPKNPINITYVAGYTSIPKSIKHAILLYVCYYFDHRDAVELSKDAERAIKSLLWRYKVRWF